ncbi:MAG TPA: hypothetical protein VK034_02350 [Enhygromyxa sp.]|nr:hypothetical protein [Enhygromyxa sp.]
MLEQHCTDLCTMLENCVVTPSDCVSDCVEGLEWFGPLCQARELVLLECLVDLSCEEFLAYAEANSVQAEVMSPYPCEAENVASCGKDCEIWGPVHEGPGDCALAMKCLGQPLKLVDCDGETCACYEDNVLVGSCDDPFGFCAAADPQPDEGILGCCG